MSVEHHFNKPRVFLSHSAKDKTFIERLSADLRKCQIDPWLDTEEIRDGKSWLKVIFEDGIPTCDSIMVYFTENSIKSKMVGKEIDSSLITQLHDSGIGLLPYVQKAELRKKLRVDLQTLQCREWKDENYQELLPSIVAEIWHSYLERTVGTAVAHEKSKRLELELEVKKQRELTEASPFTLAENTDFKYIYEALNKPVKIIFELREERSGASSELIRQEGFIFTWATIVSYCLSIGRSVFEWRRLIADLRSYLAQHGFPEKTEAKRYYIPVEDTSEIMVLLRTYGFTKTVQGDDSFGRSKREDVFTEKVFRFKYWMVYNNLLKDELPFELIKQIE